jgi:hypothetical protein
VQRNRGSIATTAWIGNRVRDRRPSSWAVSLLAAAAVLIGTENRAVAATLPDKLGSVVEDVRQIVRPPDEVPLPPLPAPPQPPVEVPRLPVEPPSAGTLPAGKAPAAKPEPVPAAPEPSGNANRASGRGGDAAAVAPPAGRAEEVSGAVAPTEGASGATRPSSSGRDDEGGLPPERRAPGRGLEQGSIEPARVAPLPRLLAYVWPAIALGPAAEALAELEGPWRESMPLSLPALPRALASLVGPIDEAAGVAGLAERSPTSSPPPDGSPALPFPNGDRASLLVLIVSGMALLALVLYAVRRELRAMHTRRWPL